MSDEYLAHHGILGQKHGHRNGPPYPLGKGDHSSSEKQAASKAGISVGQALRRAIKAKRAERAGDKRLKKMDKEEDKKKKVESEHEEQKKKSASERDDKKTPKSTKDMSDTELRDAINRLRMEKEYAQLTATGDGAMKKAMKQAATQAVADVSKQAITKLGNKAVDLAMKKAFGSDDTPTIDVVTVIKDVKELKNADGSKRTVTTTSTEKSKKKKEE